jgi:epoxyqueuosine reductase
MKTALEQLAADSGFDDCRVAPVTLAPHADALFAWLRSGSHGQMEWLGRTPERRVDPAEILPGARSLILLATNYYQGESERRVPGRIARYAWGEDYHEVLLRRMAPIDAFLRSRGGIQKCYVDTGPVLEREFAALSGLAWQGKSTMCLNEKLGTWFFIGVILTTLEFPVDRPRRNRCGSCMRCIDACPTQAITAPYRLDARRCISYLTIEHKGSIPLEFRKPIGDRIYGCDDCLEACPWNRFARETRERRFHLPEALAARSLRELAGLTEVDFRTLFRTSPIKRIKRNRFVRNVCVALGNVGTADDLSLLDELASDSDPLIAEHASWAANEIRNRAARAMSVPVPVSERL